MTDRRATLRDVLTTRNPGDLHGYVSALSSQQIDQLVTYVLQIDGDPPVHSFPFDPPWQGQGQTEESWVAVNGPARSRVAVRARCRRGTSARFHARRIWAWACSASR